MMFAEKLRKFYAIHAPDSINEHKVSKIAIDFAGKKDELNKMLRRKYGADLSSLDSEGGGVHYNIEGGPGDDLVGPPPTAIPIADAQTRFDLGQHQFDQLRDTAPPSHIPDCVVTQDLRDGLKIRKRVSELEPYVRETATMQAQAHISNGFVSGDIMAQTLLPGETELDRLGCVRAVIPNISDIYHYPVCSLTNQRLVLSAYSSSRLSSLEVEGTSHFLAKHVITDHAWLHPIPLDYITGLALDMAYANSVGMELKQRKAMFWPFYAALSLAMLCFVIAGVSAIASADNYVSAELFAVLGAVFMILALIFWGGWAKTIPPAVVVDPPAKLQRVIRIGCKDPVQNEHSVWELSIRASTTMQHVLSFIRHIQEIAPKLSPPQVAIPMGWAGAPSSESCGIELGADEELLA